MKLYIYSFFILFFYSIQGAGSPKDTIIQMVDSEWELSERIIESDGSIIEKYYRKAGPKKLPLEFHFCLCMISTPCCCCSQKIKNFLDEYKNQHTDIDDQKRKIFKEYYPYAKPDR